MHNKKFFLMFCMIFLIGISFVGAVPPLTTEFVGTEGLDIQANFQDYYRINEQSTIHIHVFNISNGKQMDNTTTSCSVELTDRNGTTLLEGIPSFENDHFHMTRPATIVTTAGSYGVTIVCNTSNLAGYKTAFFEANILGVGLSDDVGMNFNLEMMFLFGLFILALIGLFIVDNYIGKFALYWVCHILFVLGTFSLWQFNIGYAVTYFGLAGIWKVLFYVSTIAVVPMLFLSISWIVYIHLFNEHFQKLVDKGMDSEEAFAIASKKRGGWFNGQ